MMEKILASIATRLKYIKNNAAAAYVIKEADIIDIKLDDIRNRVIKTQELLDNVCDKIINQDISNMKGVQGETSMVYKKMDELAGFVEEIKGAYFNEN